MAAFSRRQLAAYAVTELLAKKSAEDIARHLAAALRANKMQKQAGLLLDDIAEELEGRGLLARAIITSAHGLPANIRQQLADQVKKATKVDNVSLTEQLDPGVIGGFRVETARRTWDKTIARKLADIKGGI